MITIVDLQTSLLWSNLVFDFSLNVTPGHHYRGRTKQRDIKKGGFSKDESFDSAG